VFVGVFSKCFAVFGVSRIGLIDKRNYIWSELVDFC